MVIARKTSVQKQGLDFGQANAISRNFSHCRNRFKFLHPLSRKDSNRAVAQLNKALIASNGSKQVRKGCRELSKFDFGMKVKPIDTGTDRSFKIARRVNQFFLSDDLPAERQCLFNC